MELTVGQIAELVGGVLDGDPSVRITGVGGLNEAGPGDLTFARSPKYFPQLRESAASAALVPVPVPDAPFATILVGQPDRAFLLVLGRFSPPPAHPPKGIHPSACVSDDAVLGSGLAVGPLVGIESGAVVGDNVVLHSGVYVGPRSRIGAGTVVYPNVVIREDTEIGARCIIHAGACIGSDGFGYVPVEGRWHKIPQTGRVILGDDVEVGSNTAIDRGTLGATRIGRGTKIDNLVQIAHNVVVGEDCAIAGMAGIAGSATIGDRVRVGAAAGINGHVVIGDDVTIGARTGITQSIGANRVVSGFPAIDHDRQRRVLVAQQRTPEMLRRIAALERRLEELESRLSGRREDGRGRRTGG
jgi:UDP-3-O-[3-hydroxymyristoyl] glucosamine N-acyltransferase